MSRSRNKYYKWTHNCVRLKTVQYWKQLLHRKIRCQNRTKLCSGNMVESIIEHIDSSVLYKNKYEVLDIWSSPHDGYSTISIKQREYVDLLLKGGGKYKLFGK